MPAASSSARFSTCIDPVRPDARPTRSALRTLTLAVTTTVAGLAAAPSAEAIVTDATRAGNFTAPSTWTRGVTANSVYALWDNSFTSVSSNAIVWDGPAGVADDNIANVKSFYASPALTGWNVVSTNPGNIVTSTERLYGNATTFVGVNVTIPNYNLGSEFTTQFQVQTNTSTVNPDAASFALSIDGGAATPITPAVTETAAFDRLYTFSVPGNASTYNLTFNTPTSGANFGHATLAALAVDTVAVPEPASLSVLVLGGLLVCRRRRR